MSPIDSDKQLEAKLVARLNEYYRAVDRGMTSLDSSPVKRVSSGVCRACKFVTSSIENAKKAGETFKVSGNTRVADAKLYQAGEVPSVTFVLKLPRVDRLNAQGKVVETLTEARESRSQAQFKKGADGSWLVFDIIRAK